MAINNVMLIGASGVLGSAVLKEFLKSSFQVTILTREESKSTFPPELPVRKANYNNHDSLVSAMQGQDAIVSMVGGGLAGEQEKIIDAALAAGVKRFIPSEFGPDTRNQKVVDAIPILPAKVRVADYLKSRESEMSWSILISGAWFDWALRVGAMNIDVRSKSVTLIDGGEVIMTTTTLPKTGKAVVSMLQHVEETKNKYVFVSSFNTCQKEVLAKIEKVDHPHKWTVNHQTSKEVLDAGYRKLEAGDFTGNYQLVAGGTLGTMALGDIRSEESWNEKLGLPQEDMEQIIKDILAEFSKT